MSKKKEETKMGKKNWLSKNWIALLALFISCVTLYLTYFSNYNLSINESTSFLLGKKENKTYIYLPLAIKNSGAKLGIIDTFFIFIYTAEGNLFFKTGAFFEISDLKMYNFQDLKPLTSFHIVGRNIEHKTIVSEIKEILKIGTYTCVIVAITSEKEKIYTTFKFTLDKMKHELFLKGDLQKLPTNKLSGITEEIEEEILEKRLNL